MKPVCAKLSSFHQMMAALFIAVAIVLAALFAPPFANTAHADDQPVGAIGVYSDSEGTQSIYSEGMQNVYDINQVVGAIEQLGSASFVKSIRLDLYTDWNTKSAGRIVVEEGMTLYLNLNGHMLNRAKAGSYSDKWYAESEGEVIYVKKNGTLKVDGGTDTEDERKHGGTLEDNNNFWSYNESGTDVITGGLITGGACDDKYGAGGISLAEEGAKAYLSNVTLAGNLTDQWDSSYGHGAGVALHGKSCQLELDNAKIEYNHAEGTGGGIYVRKDSSSVTAKNGSEILGNLGILGGGGIYVDGNDCTISFDASKINSNNTHDSGGGIYFNCKNGSITLDNGSAISSNYTLKEGGGIYNCYNGTSITLKGKDTTVVSNTAEGDGGGIYLEDVSTLTLSDTAKINSNKGANGGGVYVNDSDTTITLKGNSEIAENNATADNGCGGGIYHNGSNGSVTLNDSSKIRANKAEQGSGGAVYDCYNGTEFVLNGESSICENSTGRSDGGALYLNDEAKVTLNDTATILKNKAEGYGGAIYTDDGETYVTLNGESKVQGNNAAFGGAFYINGSTTLTLNDKGCVTRNWANTKGGAVYSSATFTVKGDSKHEGAIINNECAPSAPSMYIASDLYLENVTIGQRTDAGEDIKGHTKRSDIYYENNRTGTRTFELKGIVKLTSVFLEYDQRITGGKLESGSSVGIYHDGDERKIADLSLLDGLVDSEGKQDVLYATYEAQKIEKRSGSEDEDNDGFWITWASGDRTITLYNEDGTEKLDTFDCQAWGNYEFDNTKYAKGVDGDKQYPLWWDWQLGGSESTGRSYPNEEGKVSVKVSDLSMTLYAHYGATKEVTLKYGNDETKTKQMAIGLTAVLTGSDYQKDGVSPTSWKITYPDGSSRFIYASGSDKKASFVMPDSELTLEAQYPAILKKMSLTIGESSEYDDISGTGCDTSGKIDGVSMSLFELTDMSDHKVQPDASTLSKGITYFARTAFENEDKTAKNLTYWLNVDSDLVTSCDMEVSGELTANEIDAKISLPLIGTVSAEVKKIYFVGNRYCIELSANYEKPSGNAHTVAVNAVDVNSKETIATQDYSLVENGSIEIPVPELSGWKFCGWDTSSLPECATLDETNNIVTVSKPSDDVALAALFKPLVSKVELQVAQPEIGKEFPSELKSCKVTTSESKDITDAVTNISITWKKEDGSAVGTSVEAGTYTAAITFSYSKGGSEFDWADGSAVFVNDALATNFSIDQDNNSATVDYLVTVGGDAAYDKADESGLEQVTINTESEYSNYLPVSISYWLTDKTELRAPITWDDKTVVDESTGGFKAVGSFKDKFGVSHEVSRSFVVSFTAPTPSVKAGTYAGSQKVKLLEGDDWINPDQVQIYYAIGEADATSMNDLEFKEYSKGSFIEITKSCTLFVYAKKNAYQLGLVSYNYTIKEGQAHTVTVEGGSAFDSHGEPISEVAEGRTVYLQANEAPAGKFFDKWVVKDGSAKLEFKDASNSSTSFTMPDADVAVTATYKDPVTVATADIALPTIAAGDRLPAAAKLKLADEKGDELESIKTQLQWTTEDGTAQEAFAKTQAGKSYIVTVTLALAEDSAAVLSSDTKVTFSGKDALEQSSLDEDGKITAKFKIDIPSSEDSVVDISKAKVTLSKTAFTYNGKAQKPSVKSVVLNGKTLKSGTDYTASIASGKKVGTYKVTINAKGSSYKGKTTASFVVNPKGVTKFKVSKAKKAFKVKWTKNKTERSGVQIRYSTKKSMAGAKTVKAKGASVKAKTVKKLKKKTKYYVQARSYKVVNGKTYYSSWSAKKAVKTK